MRFNSFSVTALTLLALSKSSLAFSILALAIFSALIACSLEWPVRVWADRMASWARTCSTTFSSRTSRNFSSSRWAAARRSASCLSVDWTYPISFILVASEKLDEPGLFTPMSSLANSCPCETTWPGWTYKSCKAADI